MSITTNLHALVEDYAAKLGTLNLSGDDQEAYSTLLSWLENQADRDEPNWTIVEECRAYLDQYKAQAA